MNDNNANKENKVISIFSDFLIYSMNGIRITFPCVLLLGIFAGNLIQSNQIWYKIYGFINNLNFTFCNVYLISMLVVLWSKIK